MIRSIAKHIAGLASVLQALNQTEKAESTYIKAINLRPDDWDGYNDLAYFYIAAGRVDDALEQLQTVIRLSPEGYINYNSIGAIYFIAGKRDSALLWWERSLDIEPNYAAFSNLGAVYYMEGNYKNAAKAYNQALLQDSTDYKVWINLASAEYWFENDGDKVKAAYNHAINMAELQRRINPNDPEVLSALAECYINIGDSATALSRVSQAITHVTDNADIMLRIGNVYEELGDREIALNWISRVLDLGYPPEEIEALPEFSKLIKDPQYKSLVQMNKINSRNNEPQ